MVGLCCQCTVEHLCRSVGATQQQQLLQQPSGRPHTARTAPPHLGSQGLPPPARQPPHAELAVRGITLKGQVGPSRPVKGQAVVARAGAGKARSALPLAAGGVERNDRQLVGGRGDGGVVERPGLSLRAHRGRNA